jgi:hypothetical protein
MLATFPVGGVRKNAFARLTKRIQRLLTRKIARSEHAHPELWAWHPIGDRMATQN